MELARDNEGELGERLVTRCEQQDGLLQERGEEIFPLEADRDEVGPVERVHGVNGCTWSLGGYRNPRTLCGDAIPQRECPGVCG